jgi:hypothetical protein
MMQGKNEFNYLYLLHVDTRELGSEIKKKS